jgi:[protein-PII] uridylyltransferase
MEQLQDKVLRRRARAYTDWLSERNRERHARFGDSTYLLEPNLKEGLGGLRDYHSMLWMGRATFGIGSPRDLEFLGHLSHDEFQSLSESLSFIRNVRNWLHHLTGRKCDQLYFEYQIELAKALGFKQRNGQQGVEGFLGTLHGQMELLKGQHLTFLNKARRARKKVGRRKAERRRLIAGIEVFRDVLEFESPEAIIEKPHLLLGIFEQSAVREIPLGTEASRLVKEFLYLVDENFQRSRKVSKSFQRILSAPSHPFNVMKEMLKTGMMVALIPEMKGVVDLIQYDEYHVHPVDKHCLRTVQILQSFRDAPADAQDTLCGKLYNEIQDPDLLLWAGLLHDVGKAVDVHDHSTHGARIVRNVFERMGFSHEDIETIAFLVQQHLFLIHTATRRDINDERIVIRCARSFNDIDLLKKLYLLTVADSQATGPKAWSDWTATLLKELFFKVLNILEKGELGTQAAREVVGQKRRELLGKGVSLPGEDLGELFDQMSPRYLLYTPAEEIHRHVELYQGLQQAPFVLEAHADPDANYRSVTVCARDFPGLFSKIAGVFTLNNLDVLSAQIFTWRNHIALDVFKVKAPPDTLLEDQVWDRVRANLNAALQGELALESAIGKKVQTCQSPQKGVLRKTDEIIVDNTSSDFFTVIEIYTHDFPGLLYKITDALFRCKLDIWVAKIGTKVDQVVDVFYVRDLDGQKVDRPEEVRAIKEAIREALPGHDSLGHVDNDRR